MCCESCIRYEKCLEDDHIKDDCCPRCLEYDECSGTGKDLRDDTGYSERNTDEDNYY